MSNELSSTRTCDFDMLQRLNLRSKIKKTQTNLQPNVNKSFVICSTQTMIMTFIKYSLVFPRFFTEDVKVLKYAILSEAVGW